MTDMDLKILITMLHVLVDDLKEAGTVYSDIRDSKHLQVIADNIDSVEIVIEIVEALL